MSGKLILLVEDDAILAMHLHDLLTRKGYTMLPPVPSGEAAMRVVEKEQPSLVLMDIELAGEMNGITAAELLSAGTDIPVIFLTGYSQEVLLQQAKIAAPYGYLVKPVPERELIATIEMTLHRHQLDMQVKRSEARYRALVEQASDGIYVVDQQGNFLEVNAAGCDMVGYTRDEMLQLNIRNLVQPEALKNIPRTIQKMLDGETARFEIKLICKDRTFIDAEISGKMLEDGNLQGIVRNISARKQAEETLRESEKRFKALFENATDAILLADDHAHYVAVNAAACSLTGFSKEELLDSTVFDLTPQLNREAGMHAWQNFIASERDSGEYSIQCKDGKEIHVEYRAVANIIPGVHLSILRDVTERKQAEAVRRQLEEKFTRIFQISPDAIAITRMEDGMFVDVNQGFSKVSGYTAEEVVGKNPFELNMWLDPDEMGVLLYALHQNGKINNHEMTLRSKKGQFVYCLVSASIIEINGENCVISVSRDITERRNMEEDLRATHGFLEALLENMPLMASVMDEDGRMLRVNHAWEAFLGTSRQQALGKDISKYTPPKTAKKIKQSNQAVLNSLTPQNLELELFYNNKVHQLNAVKFPVPRNDGRYAVGTVLIDVTEDRNTRKGLEQNLADLQALYQASQTFTLLQDEKSLAASISRNAVALFEAVDIAWVELLEERSGARSVQKIFQRSRKHPREVSLAHPLLLWRQQFANIPLDSTVVLGHLDKNDLKGDIKDCVHETGICTLACLPLMHGAQRIGWLHIASRQPDAFGSDERRHVLESYANHGATALSNARLYRATSLQVREMAVIHQIGHRLQKLTTPTELAQEIIRALENIMEFDNCAVLLRDRETDALIPYAAKMRANAGVSEAEHLRRLSEADLRIGKGITGWVAQHGHSENLDDAHSDPRFIAVNPKTKSEICAPLLAGERVFGVVNVESSRLAAYSDHDMSILETLAGQIAVAVQNVQLFQSLQEGNERLRELNTRLEEVEEAERKRLANELHDQVGQNLSAINLSLNLIRSQLLPEQNMTLGARVDDSLSLLEETVQRIRSVMTELRPSILDDYGLTAALRWLGEQFAWRTGVKVEIDDQVDERMLTQVQETALFRIAQEALANISKHAAAEHVRFVIQLCANGDCFCLTIEDDGIGFSKDNQKDKSNSSGWGVNIMRERAEAIGGKLTVETISLSGTRVMVKIPVKGKQP